MRIWNTKRFLRLRPDAQDDFVSAVHAATALVPPSRDVALPFRRQLRSLAFRTGRARVVVALAENERDDRRLAELRRPLLFPLLIRALSAKARVRAARAVARIRSGDRQVACATLDETSPLSKERSVNANHAQSARGHRPDRRHAGVAGGDPREGQTGPDPRTRPRTEPRTG
jgi:hypothetical protein